MLSEALGSMGIERCNILDMKVASGSHSVLSKQSCICALDYPDPRVPSELDLDLTAQTRTPKSLATSFSPSQCTSHHNLPTYKNRKECALSSNSYQWGFAISKWGNLKFLNPTIISANKPRKYSVDRQELVLLSALPQPCITRIGCIHLSDLDTCSL